MSPVDYHIECISLSKLYSGNNQTIHAVDDVNLQIKQNESVLIKGKSGAGKSTLLNLMTGLIKPSSGRVIFENKCITEMSDILLSKVLSEKIGIIFQSFNLLPTYSIYENIEMALAPKGLTRRAINETILPLLEIFDLKNKSLSLPSELSAGQQQKVALIRTLVKEPSVIFADEPTGSVDNETAMEILEHLVNLKKEKGLTLVMATHGTIPDTYADRIFVLEKGKLSG
jgi:ABC-type lipoprotein export system ATPase subunit